MSPGEIALSVLALVLLAFAVAGLRSSTRGTPVREVRAVGGEAPSIGDPSFRTMVELYTRSELLPGHDVVLSTNGNETFPRLWEDLRGARRSITLQMYYSQPGTVADTLRDILCERARAGVDVYLLTDAWGSQKLKREYYEPLRNAGVHVQTFRPIEWHSLDRAYHRAHIRVVVIDGIIGHVGGWGIDDKWLGDGLHEDQWRDTDARFTGPAARQHQAAFASGWAEATGELLTGEGLFPAVGEMPPPGGALAALLHHVPTVGSTVGERLLMLTIAAARRTLWISNAYFVPGGALRRAMVAAVARGVDVRVLTVSRETDTQTTRYASRAFYEELLSGGVRIHEYQPAVMHAKTLVADGIWSVVGSMNFDNRSLAFNDEAVLAALDAPLAARLEAIFRADLEHAEEIHLEAFRRRPVKEKLLEKPARALAKVL